MPAFVGWIIAAVVSLAIGWLLRPKQRTSAQQATAPPPGEAEIQTVQEGKEISVFFGVVWTANSTIVWWGDQRIEVRAYKEKVSVS